MHDVIVVGGGPSGSTAANLLAKAGVSVLVLERDAFPRFHVGESLLPADLEVFERIGLDPDAHGFLYKGGAEFLDESIGGHREFPFGVALPGTPDHAYQVERSRFDNALLELARDAGAEVRQGVRVTGVSIERERVRVASTEGEHVGRYVIDATGLDALMGRSAKTNTPLTDFGLAATFVHIGDLDPGIDRELCDRSLGKGNVKIFFREEGWAWLIPLGDRRASAGMVTRKKGLVPEWLSEVFASPFLSRVLRGTKETRKRGTLASFSFHNREQHGARWVCAGDSACFLDPVFSSGVSLGMLGAAHIADVLVPALREGSEGEADLMDEHALHMARGYDVFATLIHAWYHSKLLHHLFFAPEPDPIMLRGVTTVLAGDVWRDDNPFQEKLMASSRRRQALPPTQRGMPAKSA